MVDSSKFPAIAAPYRLIRRVGRGANGEVFLAHDDRLDRPIAVKFLAGLTGSTSVEATRRFLREAQLLGSRPHAALVPIYDLDLEASPPYLVLGWMSGGDLAGESLRTGPAPTAAVVALGIRLASGLAHLHENGVLHRDIKPANILLNEDGEAYLADLGLAKDLDGSRLTGTGYLVGTPYYMAPELLKGAHHSALSDLYSLGVLLLETARGEPLARLARERDHLQAALDLIADPALRRVLRGALVSDPTLRTASASMFLNELEALEVALAAGEPPPSMPKVSPAEERTRTQELSPPAAIPITSAPSSTKPRYRLMERTAGGFLSLVFFCLYYFEVSVPSPPALPQPPPVPRAMQHTHPLSGIGLALARDLDQLLESKRTQEDDFLARYWAQGAGVMNDLEVEERFFRWLQDGGRPEALPPEVIRDLRQYDQTLADLGIPPTFAPFLVGPLDSSETASLASLLAYPSFPDWHLPDRPLRTSAWANRALHELIQALQARDKIWKRLAAQHPDWMPTYVPPDHRQSGTMPVRPLEVYTKRAKLLAWNLEKTTSELGPLRRHFRAFHYATIRALEEGGSGGIAAGKLFWTYVYSLEPTFTGSLPGRSPRRLLGPTPSDPRALIIYAETLRMLRVLGRALVSPVPRTMPLEEQCRVRVLQVGASSHFAGEEAISWFRLIKIYRRTAERSRCRETIRQHRERYLRYLSDGMKLKLREIQAWSLGSAVSSPPAP